MRGGKISSRDVLGWGEALHSNTSPFPLIVVLSLPLLRELPLSYALLTAPLSLPPYLSMSVALCIAVLVIMHIVR